MRTPVHVVGACCRVVGTDLPEKIYENAEAPRGSGTQNYSPMRISASANYWAGTLGVCTVPIADWTKKPPHREL